MTDIIVLDRATGALVQYARVRENQVGLYENAQNMVLAFPHSGISTSISNGQTVLDLDLAVLKPALRARVDRDVGEVRATFITDVPGQAQTYEKKEAEARLWTDGDEVTHPERYPFMLTEAQVRGVTIAQVQAEIMAQVDALTPVAATVEAHRIAAKAAISAASTASEAVLAAAVDWQAVLTP